MMRKRFGKNDILFLSGIILVVIILFVSFTIFRKKTGSFVVVTINGQKSQTYLLSQEESVEIETKWGTNQFVIKENTVKMIQADCPDQLCVHQHAISQSRESIICLPHKVVVTIEGEENSTLDAVAN